MTKKERMIYEVLRQDPMASQEEIARRVEISRSSVSVHIANMMKKGYIKGRGYVLEDEAYAVLIRSVNMDIYGYKGYGDDPSGSIFLSPGGKSRNIGEALTRLGVSVKLLSSFGGDLFGEQMFKECRQKGIDVSQCRIMQEYPSGMFMAALGTDRHVENLVYDMRINATITPEYISAHEKMIAGAGMLVICGLLPKDTCSYIMGRFGGRMPIICDMHNRNVATRMRRFLPKINALKIEMPALRHLAGRSDLSEEAAEAYCVKLQRSCGGRIMLVENDSVLLVSENGSAMRSLALQQVVSPVGGVDGLTTALACGEMFGLSEAATLELAVKLYKLCCKCREPVNGEIVPDFLQNVMN